MTHTRNPSSTLPRAPPYTIVSYRMARDTSHSAVGEENMGKEELMAEVDARFRRLMPKTTDLTLLVLKGHLLIEEELQAFLEMSVKEPKALDDARLTFIQKYH